MAKGVVEKADFFLDNYDSYSFEQLQYAYEKNLAAQSTVDAGKGKAIKRLNKADGKLREAMSAKNPSRYNAYIQEQGEGYAGGPEDPTTGRQDGVNDTQDNYGEPGGEKEQDYLQRWEIDPNVMDLFNGKNADVKLMAMAMDDAKKGRGFAVNELRDLQDRARVLEEPVLSDEDISGMKATQRGKLAQSYQGEQQNLSNFYGGEGLDPTSGVGRELAAALKFNTNMSDAQLGSELEINAKQLNRAGLERGLGLQTGISGGIANMLAGQPLADLAGPASALAAAKMIDVDGNIWRQFGMDMAKSLFGAAGTYAGAQGGV